MFKLGYSPEGYPTGPGTAEAAALSQANMQRNEPRDLVTLPSVTQQVCLPNALTVNAAGLGTPSGEERARRMARLPSLCHLDGVIAPRYLVPTRCQELHMYYFEPLKQLADTFSTHFRGEETAVQRGFVTCLRSHS